MATGAWREFWTAPPEAEGFGIAVSPDARQLASIKRAKDSSWFAVVVVPTAGGVAREVLRVGRPEVMAVYCWMADRKSLLVTRRDIPASGAAAGPHLAWPLDSGEPVALGIAEYGLHDVRVHPDGRQIAFVAGGGRNEFWTLTGLVK